MTSIGLMDLFKANEQNYDCDSGSWLVPMPLAMCTTVTHIAKKLAATPARWILQLLPVLNGTEGFSGLVDERQIGCGPAVKAIVHPHAAIQIVIANCSTLFTIDCIRLRRLARMALYGRTASQEAMLRKHMHRSDMALWRNFVSIFE